MKRNYLSSDFIYESVNGTFNMLEKRSFLASKMIDIEDELNISNSDIIYYQSATKEQINLTAELSLAPITYAPSESKQKWSSILIDDKQSDYEKDNLTKWSLNINVYEILVENIFANIKKERTFEGVLSNRTKFNDIDLAIVDYIKQNLISRYKVENIILYVKYKSIQESGNRKFMNNWNRSIIDKSNILSKIETQYDFNKSNCIVKFKQENISNSYSFDYYFDLIFKKI